MEHKNHRVIRDFLDPESRAEIIEYVNSIDEKIYLDNRHLEYLIAKINGNSYMYDVAKTDLTSKITKYQSGGHVMQVSLPPVFDRLISRISREIAIPKEHSFLQIIKMDSGGKIGKHYDAAIDGFINYKCNISVISEDYRFYIDNETIEIGENDLYCFEASLYKHWTDSFTTSRILLSFGFLVRYEELGRDYHDPRTRLSRRITKYIQ